MYTQSWNVAQIKVNWNSHLLVHNFVLCRTIIETVDLRGYRDYFMAYALATARIHFYARSMRGDAGRSKSCIYKATWFTSANILRDGAIRRLWKLYLPRTHGSRVSVPRPFPPIPSRINSEVPSADGARQLTATYGRSWRRRKKKSNPADECLDFYWTSRRR